MTAKVSKIMIWPNRKINLLNYNTADLNAGVEMVFDTPVEVDSEELKSAFNEARKIVKNEFSLQYEPYKKLLISNKGDK